MNCTFTLSILTGVAEIPGFAPGEATEILTLTSTYRQVSGRAFKLPYVCLVS